MGRVNEWLGEWVDRWIEFLVHPHILSHFSSWQFERHYYVHSAEVSKCPRLRARSGRGQGQLQRPAPNTMQAHDKVASPL